MKKDILTKIDNVEQMTLHEIDMFLEREYGVTFVNGSGSRRRYKFPNSVWTVHHNGKGLLKHGIVRELKGVLIKEKILPKK